MEEKKEKKHKKKHKERSFNSSVESRISILFSNGGKNSFICMKRITKKFEYFLASDTYRVFEGLGRETVRRNIRLGRILSERLTIQIRHKIVQIYFSEQFNSSNTAQVKFALTH